jgi:hypothetical protein
MNALVAYLMARPKSKAKHVFLVEKGPCRGKPPVVFSCAPGRTASMPFIRCVDDITELDVHVCVEATPNSSDTIIAAGYLDERNPIERLLKNVGIKVCVFLSKGWQILWHILVSKICSEKNYEILRTQPRVGLVVQFDLFFVVLCF